MLARRLNLSLYGLRESSLRSLLKKPACVLLWGFHTSAVDLASSQLLVDRSSTLISKISASSIAVSAANNAASIFTSGEAQAPSKHLPANRGDFSPLLAHSSEAPPLRIVTTHPESFRAETLLKLRALIMASDMQHAWFGPGER